MALIFTTDKPAGFGLAACEFVDERGRLSRVPLRDGASLRDSGTSPLMPSNAHAAECDMGRLNRRRQPTHVTLGRRSVPPAT